MFAIPISKVDTKKQRIGWGYNIFNVLIEV